MKSKVEGEHRKEMALFHLLVFEDGFSKRECDGTRGVATIVIRSRQQSVPGLGSRTLICSPTPMVISARDPEPLKKCNAWHVTMQ